MPSSTTDATAQPEGHLPMSRAEMAALGWDAIDVLLVTGDAYVDDPSFGAALLGRWLAAHGFRVGIVAQPRWASPEDMRALGRPRLFAGVTAGALDSMLAHYTAFRKKRSDDAYTPGGAAGARPNRATIVYTGLVRAAFPGLPVVAGGIEASLRRITHYDFWGDALRRSILLDSKADLLVHGMGERAVLEIARRLDIDPGADLRGIPATAFASPPGAWPVPAGAEMLDLPPHEACLDRPGALMDATLALEQQVHGGVAWARQTAGGREVVIAPPAEPLAPEELDRLYALPFTRDPHPSYTAPIPAVEVTRFSITSHRGCGGGCAFCSLALHQGRRIRSRTPDGIVAEVQAMTRHPAWTGSVSDVGGPSANMWGARCAASAACRRASCLHPRLCPHFRSDQPGYARLLDMVAAVPGVRHVRVASGIRHDLALEDETAAAALIERYVGGQLKLAPEHCAGRVLNLMRKPGFDAFEGFLTVFERHARGKGRQLFVVPYLLSALPGCTDEDMRALADWFRKRGWRPRQVQCFIPTPGTVATAMYHAGTDTEGRPIPVARTDAERLRQHRILVGTASRTGSRQQGGRGSRSGTRNETRGPRNGG